MKIKKYIPFFLMSAVLFACNSAVESDANNEVIEDFFDENYEDEAEEYRHVGDNSEVSLDWAGTYEGVLPCADCEGVETVLVIESDGSYELTSNYLTQKSDETEFKDRGMIKWDESGSNVTLISTLDTERRQFKVGENQLFYLDEEGNVIEGELAENYILRKQ